MDVQSTLDAIQSGTVGRRTHYRPGSPGSVGSWTRTGMGSTGRPRPPLPVDFHLGHSRFIHQPGSRVLSRRGQQSSSASVGNRRASEALSMTSDATPSGWEHNSVVVSDRALSAERSMQTFAGKSANVHGQQHDDELK